MTGGKRTDLAAVRAGPDHRPATPRPAKPGSDEGGRCRGSRRDGPAQVRRSERAHVLARNCCLWTADVAEAVFVDAARGEEVQLIHHVVMTTYKRPVNPGRLQYR